MTKKAKEILFTKEGFEELKKEYEDLVNKQRPSVVEEIQNARALGDLSENGMYSAAREKQSFIEGRIRELEEIMKRAKISKPSDGGKKSEKQISLGHKVTVEIQKKEVEFHIVGAEEVDFQKNKISHESPLGKALIGKTIDDQIEVETPSGLVRYKVVDII